MKAKHLFFLALLPFTGLAQVPDSLQINNTEKRVNRQDRVYEKPKPFLIESFTKNSIF